MNWSLFDQVQRIGREIAEPDWVKGSFEVENAWAAGVSEAIEQVLDLVADLPPEDHLMERFAYYTECQLATLEGLKGVKRTSKYELGRQTSIAEGMIAVCRSYPFNPEWKCSRLKERLDAQP